MPARDAVHSDGVVWLWFRSSAQRRGAPVWLNRYQLATRYDAVFRDVYMPRGHEPTAVDKAIAAWL